MKQRTQINIRIEPELLELLKGKPVSDFVREAIKEKLKKDKEYKTCPTCKGTGFVRK